MVTPLFQKIIISTVVVLFLAYVGYGLYNVTPDPSILADSFEVDSASQDILTLVSKMENISFDQSVFTSQLFTNLVDYSVTINQEQVGRPNPFAPIGADIFTLNNISLTQRR